MLLRIQVMKNAEKILDCYIGGLLNAEIDPFLENHGFTRGLVVFSIPAYGTLFRCRVEGNRIDLEFGALFSLLRFIADKLPDEKIRRVRIHSSNPEFVFAFGGAGKHLAKGSAREKMLREFSMKFQITVAYIESRKNRSLHSAADYPSVPPGQKLPFRPSAESSGKTRFQPFQKGIRL